MRKRVKGYDRATQDTMKRRRGSSGHGNNFLHRSQRHEIHRERHTRSDVTGHRQKGSPKCERVFPVPGENNFKMLSSGRTYGRGSIAGGIAKKT